MTAPPKRLDSARRRLRIARYGIAAFAAAGFAGGVAVARAAHPGSHAQQAVTGTLDAPQSFRDAEQSALDFGGSAIAPAAGTDQPAVQSAGS